MQVIVLYCLLCSSLCLSLQEYSLGIRPYVYVYVHQRIFLRLRLRPLPRLRPRAEVREAMAPAEQNRNMWPEHAAKPQGLAHGQTLGKGFQCCDR